MPVVENSSTALDVSAFAERVVHLGGVVVARGLAPGRITRAAPTLRDELYEFGHLLLVLDPASADPAEQHFDAVLRAYETAVDRRVGLTDEAMRLVETLASRSHALLSEKTTRAMRFETVGRLWTLLSRDVPAVLLVADPEALSAADRAALEWLTCNVFSDPIVRLAPEARAWETAAGSLVFAPEAPDWCAYAAHEIDYTEETEQAVRDLLATDEIVRRFAEASRGDVERLAQLVDRLPESTTPIRLLAALRLDADVRTVLQLAAVADTTVTPDLLGSAFERLAGAHYFSSALRKLCHDGFLRRTMGSGNVLVHIDDSALASSLRDDLDGDVQQAMHDSLAEAALELGSDDFEFVARHLVGAGRGGQAAGFALKAGRRLLDGDALEDAVEQFELVLEFGDEDLAIEAHSGLVDAHSRRGDIEHALHHCNALDQLLEGEAKTALAVRTAQLLNTFGSNNDALELFDRALAESPAAHVRFDALIGKAETLYSQAHYDQSRETAEETLVELEEEMERSNERLLHMNGIRLRNLLGKVAIFQDRLDDAETLFERNADEAARWAWDDEVSRARANLGIVAMQRGDDTVSLERLLAALDTVGVSGGLPRAYCLINLATLFQKADRYEEALDHCLEGMRCAKRISDRLAYRSAANNLASIYHDLGAFDRSEDVLAHLESVDEEGLDLFARHLGQLARANMLLARGDAAEAAPIFERLQGHDVPRFVSDQAAFRFTEASVALEQWDTVGERLESADRSTAWSAHWTMLEAAHALQAGEAERAASLAGRAVEDLGKSSAIKARLIRVAALESLGRDAEAQQILADGARVIIAALERVPTKFAQTYVQKPAHLALLREAEEADVDLPARITSWLHESEAAPVETPSRAEFTAWRNRYEDIVGEDQRLHHVFRMVDRVAASDATVLINGESGTGKELVASAIHRESDRSNKPFVKVNCAAFVENLLLSELFGHEKGAFTGAVAQKDGRFTLADGGTIFLDEIGDISPNTQVALLRVLQEGTFERVGGSDTQTVDVRVVCATNKNLEELVERGEFRLDLYYRLKGVVLEMPALRDRRDDIPRLVRHFATVYSPESKLVRFAPAVHQFLASYSWPGNVRELQNFVKSVLLFADGSFVTMEQIEEFREFFSSGTVNSKLPPVDLSEEIEVVSIPQDIESSDGELFEDPEEALVEQLVAAGGSLSDLKKRIEIECIKRALIETEGNVTRAAEILQMKRPRLSQIVNGTDELAKLKQQLVS
jgi:transcriptional regulator with GAF, ATPase, and Fis domain